MHTAILLTFNNVCRSGGFCWIIMEFVNVRIHAVTELRKRPPICVPPRLHMYATLLCFSGMSGDLYVLH